MDFSEYLRFLVALIFVLGLIVTIALVARRAGMGFPITASKSATERRLSVIEVTPVDGRRRMVLVRRDNVEHLLLLGPASEIVIEAGIPVTADKDIKSTIPNSQKSALKGKFT
jgi:flagellar protein FliO/FliZ